MDREETIQHITNSDITNDDFVRWALTIAREEEDDLVRGIARCFLQDKSLQIIDRLLNT